MHAMSYLGCVPTCFGRGSVRVRASMHNRAGFVEGEGGALSKEECLHAEVSHPIILHDC